MKTNPSKIFNQALHVLLISGCLYGVILGYNLWLDRSKTFKVKTVRVTGNEYFSRDEILKLGEISESSSIWQVSLNESTKKIQKHPFIDRVHITRMLPDILSIRVDEKKPTAALNFEHSIYFLDRSGMVMPNIPGKGCDLPLISGDFKGGVMIGHAIDNDWIDEGLEFVQKIQTSHPELYRNISEIVVGKKEGMMLLLGDKALPVYLGNKDRNQRIYALEAVLKDLQNNKQMHLVSYINLKFNDQVVVGMGA